MSAVTKGACLCGAVQIKVAAPMAAISACHCEMCRKWSGSIQMGINVAMAAISVSGPVKTYRSSRFAERAWCETCGSALWLRDIAGAGAGSCDLVPGLFENAANATLIREVYADRCPSGYALSGDHARVSRAEYETNNSHVREGAAP